MHIAGDRIAAQELFAAHTLLPAGWSSKMSVVLRKGGLLNGPDSIARAFTSLPCRKDETILDPVHQEMKAPARSHDG